MSEGIAVNLVKEHLDRLQELMFLIEQDGHEVSALEDVIDAIDNVLRNY